MRASSTTLLGLLLTLSACATPGTGPRARITQQGATAAPRASLAPVGLAVPTPPPGLLGGALVTDNGSGLVGNRGGNVIGNHGAGAVATTIDGMVRVPPALIGNNGAGYGLLATGDVPYAGAYVYLVDADGRPLAGPDQQPVVSKTDAAGRYGFTGMLPAGSNFMVVASLPGGRGQVGAIAPKGATRQADVDLASTLETGYVLERYVRPQGGHQAVLDKLPPDVEATTRAAMAQAVAASTTPLPDAITAQAIVARVDALRAGAPPLDEQLEIVRALLVAGLSDLGVGRPATEAALPWIRGVVAAPDGGFWLNAALSGRVFLVDRQGILTTAAGSSAGLDQGSLVGKPAVQAGLGTIQGLLPDAKGRLLILEQHRLTRLETDGTLTELWPYGAPALYAVGQAAGEAYWLLAADGLHRVEAGKPPTLERPLPAEASFFRRAASFGQDTRGDLVLYAAGSPYGEIRRYAPASGTLAVEVAANADDVRGMAVDAAGRIYLQGADGSVRLREAGAERPLVGAAAGVTVPYAQFALTPEGDVLWALLGNVQRVSGDQKRLVAGKLGVSVDATGQLALNRPGGLLLEPDGALVLSVAGDNQVVRVQGSDVQVLAGTGTSGTAGDGGPATAAQLANPTALRRDAAGARYVLTAGRAVRRIGPDGEISTIYALPATPGDRRIYDFAVTQDGKTLYVTGAVVGSTATPRDGFVTRLDLPSLKETPVIAPSGATQPTAVIALDAQERLHLMGEGKLRRWDPAAGFSQLAADPTLTTTTKWTALGRAAFDAQGRFWYFTGNAAAQLYRLENGQAHLIAGPGGQFLNGEGVDDSLANGMAPAFAANGDVLLCDYGHNQVKRLPGAAR